MKKTLLLGNGFSSSLCSGFTYKKLYDIATSELEDDKKLTDELARINLLEHMTLSKSWKI